MVFWGTCFPKYADAAAVAAAVAIVVKAPLSVKFICPWYGDACSAAWAAAAATSAIVSVGDNGPLAWLLPSAGIGVVRGCFFAITSSIESGCGKVIYIWADCGRIEQLYLLLLLQAIDCLVRSGN